MALSQWLATNSNIPPSRIESLLTILSDHWIDDVATLRRCYTSLEKHLPAAAYEAIGAALGSKPPLIRADTMSAPPSPRRAPPMKIKDSSAGGLYRLDENKSGSDGSFKSMRSSPALDLKAVGALDFAPKQTTPDDSFVRQVAAHRKQMRRMFSWTLMPNSRWTRRWDLLLVLVLGFTATVTPFEVGFLPPVELNPLFYANRAVDFIFALDIILNFFTAYRADAEHGGAWVFGSHAVIQTLH